VLVSEQNNTFDSDDLFRDFNTNEIDMNEIEIDSIVECFLLNKATTTAKSKIIDLKSKKEQLWEQFTG
jgi:hypothetical protein